MTDVFISYSHLDGTHAAELRDRVAAQGLVPFLAEDSLPKGEKWAPNIMEALREAKWVFVLATPNSLTSPAVQHEISGAVYGGKNILPIIVGVEPSELPPWLAEIHGIVADEADPNAMGEQISTIVSRIKSEKVIGYLVAAAVVGFVAYCAFKK